ncbi:hypothetical protein C8Q76DRAFT_754858 [Earliella scabrosa]|nr:hypothetical protein C8Q76DRAFT_754858 [Earliella scabrosa]
MLSQRSLSIHSALSTPRHLSQPPCNPTWLYTARDYSKVMQKDDKMKERTHASRCVPRCVSPVRLSSNSAICPGQRAECLIPENPQAEICLRTYRLEFMKA